MAATLSSGKKLPGPKALAAHLKRLAKTFPMAQPEEGRQPQPAEIGAATGPLACTHCERAAGLVAPDHHPAGAQVFADEHRGLERAGHDGERETGTAHRRHRSS